MKLDIDPRSYPELDMQTAIEEAARHIPEWIDQMCDQLEKSGEMAEIRAELAELENIEIDESELKTERELFGEDLPDDV